MPQTIVNSNYANQLPQVATMPNGGHSFKPTLNSPARHTTEVHYPPFYNYKTTHIMKIREFTEIVTEFQSSLPPYKARVLNPDPHDEGSRKSSGLTHLCHKLSILVTLRECAETAWRHLWESGTKAIMSFKESIMKLYWIISPIL